MKYEHSSLPPSSSARRGQCPGSRYLESILPRFESPYSKEGTLAHELADKMLKDEDVSFSSEEMKANVSRYVKYVKSFDVKVYSEYRVRTLFNLSKKLRENDLTAWGTVDSYLIKERALHVFDFKYGFTPVSVVDNAQLLSYAGGLISMIEKEIDNVILHIVQPRDYSDPIKTQSLTFSEFIEKHDSIEKYELKSLDIQAPLKVGKECKFCSARYMCPELQKSTLETKALMEIDKTDVSNYTELSTELKSLKEAENFLKYRIEGIEEHVLNRLKQGEIIPYFRLSYVDSREKWNVPNSVIEILEAAHNVKLFKPADPITPKQAVSLGVPRGIVTAMSVTPVGAAKLILDK